MAFQPESATYDTGVLQLETTTPVQGGVGGASNTPLLSLSNRTAYLKAHVDALEAAATGNAPTNSPNFTGDPRAPTPAVGDNDTSLATTAFVQNAQGGLVVVNVAGGANVVLTAAQAGCAIIFLTGAITANIAVIVPSATDRWVFINNTTGAFTISVKTAAGPAFVIPGGGYASDLVCDGATMTGCSGVVAPTLAAGDRTNSIANAAWVQSLDDVKAPLNSPVFTGDPRAPTPAAGDNDTSIATTAFVQAVVAPLAPLASPHLTGVPTAPTAPTASNDATLATTAFAQALMFATHASSLGNPGWQKLPSGLIIQWGQALASTGIVGMTFPIAFPNAMLQLVVTGYIGANLSANVGAATYSVASLTGATLLGSIASNCTFNYIAIGV